MVEFFQGKVVFILLVFQTPFSAMGGESCGLAPVFCHFVLGRVFSVHLSALRLPAVRWPDWQAAGPPHPSLAALCIGLPRASQSIGFPTGSQGALCFAKVPVPAASALFCGTWEAFLHPISKGHCSSPYESVNGPVCQIFFSPASYFFLSSSFWLTFIRSCFFLLLMHFFEPTTLGGFLHL